MQDLIEKLSAEDGMTKKDCTEIQDFITDSFFQHGKKDSGSYFRQPLLYVRVPTPDSENV
jgi:hypothetical protein